MASNNEKTDDRQTTKDLEKAAAGCGRFENRRQDDRRAADPSRAPDLGAFIPVAGGAPSAMDRGWRDRYLRTRPGDASVPDTSDVAIEGH